MNIHALEALTDGPLESREPTLDSLGSGWSADIVSHIEATGLFAETAQHNADLANGEGDPGFIPVERLHRYIDSRGIERSMKRIVDTICTVPSQMEVDDERDDDDAMAIAMTGGLRHYETEQGFARLDLTVSLIEVPNADAWTAARLTYSLAEHGGPRGDQIRKLAYKLARDEAPVDLASPLPNVTLFPGLVQRPNGDALTAAMLDATSPATDIDIPELSQSRRHWRDVGPDEQAALLTGFDAEDRPQPVNDPVLSALGVADVPRTNGLTDIDREELAFNAPDYDDHLNRMAADLKLSALRDWEHAQACLADADRVDHLGRVFNPILVTNGYTVPTRCRRTMPSHPSYRERTKRWREANVARRAALAARCRGDRAPFDPFADIVRTTGPIPAAPLPEPVYHGRPVDVLRFIAEAMDAPYAPYTPPAPEPERSPTFRRIDGVAELPDFHQHRWWELHGHRIEAMAGPRPVIWPHQLVRGFQIDEAWLQAAQDAYYVLKYGGPSKADHDAAIDEYVAASDAVNACQGVTPQQDAPPHVLKAAYARLQAAAPAFEAASRFYDRR